MRSLILSFLCVGLIAGPAAAVSKQERCEAFQLTASGKRILAKLRCRAKAKLKGDQIKAGCLDRAEKQYLMYLQQVGPDCMIPDELVTFGAEADAQMGAVVASLDTTASTIPDLSGTWQTRTILRVNPSGGFSLDCQYYPVGQCPVGGLLSITDCTTTMTASGATYAQTSQCTTPNDSPVKLGSFTQGATGGFDPVTGEWTLEGTVFVPAMGTNYSFSGEGVYSQDGQTMTGITTAGFAPGQSLWIATTTGHKVD